ncbi:unnamed protein product [Rotaria magnacalcarata]|uniref:Uncharacterized protein n=1 Tax=Rotaria magnacalcarata TaxID=392030 RepID=A0A816SUY0_9BILA|nr:unnamed protein product [Rotaria magnacalcarata]
MVLRTSLNNSGDTVKCRGASATATVPIGVVADKCAGICNTFPGATLATDNCTMSYTASVVGFWAVSLMMEDYEFTWQTTPLSATSLQFLVQLYTSRSSSCIVGPAYTENRPVGACVGVDINQTVVETATFSVDCTGVTFSDVLTTSPPGMTRDVITQSTTNALVYSITITWIPPASAWGSNRVCYIPIDSLGQQGDTQCVTYRVDVLLLHLNLSIQSPVGTVLANQSSWRVECTKAVNRPSAVAYIPFFQLSTASQVQTTASTTIASILTVSTLGVSTTTANANITTTEITVPSSTTLYTQQQQQQLITYPPVQIVNSSVIIQRCERPAIAGTLLSTTVVRAI